MSISGSATTGATNVVVTNPDAGTSTDANAFTVNGPPTVTSLNPSSRGQGATSQNVTVTGTNFVNGSQLASTIAHSGDSGVTVNSTTYVSSTSLTVNVTVASNATVASNYSFNLTNGDGSTATLANAFTVNGPPTVTSLNPSTGDQGATNESITVTGTGFQSGAAVTFPNNAGITVNSTTFNSSTSLTLSVSISGSATTGATNVVVTNPDAGTSTDANAFTVNGPPTVTSLNPSTGDRGATNESITVTGTNFVNGSQLASTIAHSGDSGVTVNSTTYVSSTSLTLSVSISGSATVASNYSFNLTNGDGSTATLANAFTVNGPPTVTSLNPSTGDRGATNESVSVTGTNFDNDGTGFSASFSGQTTPPTVNSVTYVNSTTLTLSVSISGSATTGAYTFNLTNSDGSTATLANAFTVNGPPTVTSLNPSSRGQGATSQNVTVTGTNFVNGSQLASTIAHSGDSGVTVNSTTFVSSTSLTVNVTVASNATVASNYSFNLTNGDGSTATLANAFTVNGPPTVTSLNPSTGDQGATNESITVTGTGFQSGAAVTFPNNAGITVNSTTFNSSTSLTLSVSISGSATTGATNVVVTNPDAGTSTDANAFTVNGPPTVTSLNPSTGDRGATNESITVTGTNFVNGSQLASTIAHSGDSGVTVNSTTYVSSTSLTLSVSISGSATVASNYSFNLTNGDGSTATLANAFTVNGPPTVTSLNPSTGDRGATNESVSVTGTNFDNDGTGFSASFSGQTTPPTVNSVTYVNSTTLTLSVSISGSATTGAYTFNLTNSDGSTATLANAFTVNGPPTVTSLNPSSRGQGATSQNVTVTGTNFVNGSQLASTIAHSGDSGVTVNSTTFNSSTSLTVNVTVASNATVASNYSFNLTNGDGSTATLANAFTVTSGITQVQEANAPTTTTGSSVTVTLPNNVTAGDALILSYASESDSGNAPTSVTYDSQGFTKEAHNVAVTGNGSSQIWALFDAPGGAKTVTITLTGNTYVQMADVTEWSGLNGTVDQATVCTSLPCADTGDSANHNGRVYHHHHYSRVGHLRRLRGGRDYRPTRCSQRIHVIGLSRGRITR